jgi:hypothetical protein
MRDPWPAELEVGRLLVEQDVHFGTSHGERFGAFYIANGLKIIANDAWKESDWWEHVSVSLPDRTPTWEEMCRVKDLFWAPNEVVLQFHPAKHDYVNCHPFTLHLWRHKWKMKRVPLPPPVLVGPSLNT